MPKAPSPRGLSPQATGGVQARTPSVIACGDATFPKGTASVVAAKFPALLKGVPLGELANAVSLRG